MWNPLFKSNAGYRQCVIDWFSYYEMPDGFWSQFRKTMSRWENGNALFEKQAVTIGKSGSEVSIQCDNGDDANDVFLFLTNVFDKEPDA